MAYTNGSIFTLHGHTFRVEIEHDQHAEAPWVQNDCHGPVREVRTNHTGYTSKRPGERLLERAFSYRASHGYAYDWAEAMRIARRDGWGIPQAEIEAWTQRSGRAPTPGLIAQAAVQRDFDYLRRWLTDDWHYVGVIVRLLDDEGDSIEESSLWGIESDARDYIDEVARENAEDILYRLKLDPKSVATEAAETAYWAARGVITTINAGA